jgi:uncharacterized membrane protein YkoI
MKQRIAIAAVSGAVVAAAAAAAAYAAGPNENDALAVSSAKISLSQAVAAAEQKVSGKAAKAEFEQAKGGRWVYDVEVVSGAKVFDVSVDADTGNVIASVEDKNDRDDDHDEKD